MCETWLPMPIYNGVDFKGFYEISNFGKIRSTDRYITYLDGRKKFMYGAIKKAYIACKYEIADLQIPDSGGKRCHVLVHRAVALAFIPNDDPQNKTEVNHIDENKLNNRYDNLEWCTKSYNQKYYADRHKPLIIRHCECCGKQLSSYTKGNLCQDCFNKQRHNNAVKRCKKAATRDELKALIRATPFLQIGKQFGTSDNMVRKWCKLYGLPYRVSEIKKYTDEEWENI